jgi:hypothetical protein
MINPATFVLMVIIGTSPPQQLGEFYSYHQCYEAGHVRFGGVVDVLDPSLQTAIADLHGGSQRHDVHEGGGQAGVLRRGLRGAARAFGRIHPIVSRSSSSATAPAAPGMRTRPSAAGQVPQAKSLERHPTRRHLAVHKCCASQ